MPKEIEAGDEYIIHSRRREKQLKKNPTSLIAIAIASIN
jgi:hypothetical protein